MLCKRFIKLFTVLQTAHFGRRDVRARQRGEILRFLCSMTCHSCFCTQPYPKDTDDVALKQHVRGFDYGFAFSFFSVAIKQSL
jgi:hypothetical protein